VIGTGNGNRPPFKADSRTEAANTNSLIPTGMEELHLRVQQLSLREQMERSHFLLERLSASSTRLVQTLESGDVYEAIAEIIANLIGSEEIAIFDYCSSSQAFSLAWSWGVEAGALQPFVSGAGMFGRAVHEVASQFHERQQDSALLPFEKHLTACVILKSGREAIGVIAIFGLLPQKNCLEWADYELLKFLENHAALAIQFQKLQAKQVQP
jgi:hypothetical protein